MSKKQLNITQKIFRISRAANVVAKNGVAEDGNAYATMGDVLDAVEKLMLRHKVILIPGNDGTVVSDKTVSMLWRLIDTEQQTEVQMSVPGGGDGEHAIAKAVTGSRKAALVCLFNLRVADGEAMPTRAEAVELADAVAQKKIEQAKKRAETKARKEYVVVTIPAAHNGNKVLFRGRIPIMEHEAFDYMNIHGKWVEREQGWLVDIKVADEVESTLLSRGCVCSREAE